jgi:hypothetical protein
MPAGEAITARRRKPHRTGPAGQHDGGEGDTAQLRAARRGSVRDPTLVRAAARRAAGGPPRAGGRRGLRASPAAVRRRRDSHPLPDPAAGPAPEVF